MHWEKTNEGLHLQNNRNLSKLEISRVLFYILCNAASYCKNFTSKRDIFQDLLQTSNKFHVSTCEITSESDCYCYCYFYCYCYCYFLLINMSLSLLSFASVKQVPHIHLWNYFWVMSFPRKYCASVKPEHFCICVFVYSFFVYLYLCMCHELSWNILYVHHPNQNTGTFCKYHPWQVGNPFPLSLSHSFFTFTFSHIFQLSGNILRIIQTRTFEPSANIHL